MTNKTLPIKDPRIQDNVFYVVQNGKSFDILVNGNEIYEFMGWQGWSTKALLGIKKRQDANDLAGFLNRLYSFGQETKQKEIQKVLGIQTKEDVGEVIKEQISELRTEMESNFPDQLSNSYKLDELIDKKLSAHTRDYRHDTDHRDY